MNHRPEAQLAEEEIGHASAALAEDLRSPLLVELEEFARAKPHREPNRDDPAGGGTGDQIEVAADRLRQVLLEPRQESGRKRAENPAPVDAQDAPLGRVWLRSRHVRTGPLSMDANVSLAGSMMYRAGCSLPRISPWAMVYVRPDHGQTVACSGGDQGSAMCLSPSVVRYGQQSSCKPTVRQAGERCRSATR